MARAPVDVHSDAPGHHAGRAGLQDREAGRQIEHRFEDVTSEAVTISWGTNRPAELERKVSQRPLARRPRRRSLLLRNSYGAHGRGFYTR